MPSDWIVQPPEALRRLFPRSLWRDADHTSKRLYVSFDDGPVPEQTPWVLDTLARHGARATFFCVGENVRRHPGIFESVVAQGHAVGNHTYNHVPLFRVGWRAFSSNADLCTEAMGGGVRLFRAPHGHLTPWHAWLLTRGRFERVVFWDVMPKDYDNRLTEREVWLNVRRFARPGSVIVFHDSIKAGPRMRYALERTLEEFGAEGYEFAAIGQAAATHKLS